METDKLLEFCLNADCKGGNLSQLVEFAKTRKKCKIVQTRENVLSSRFVRLSKFAIIKPQHCDKQTVLSSAKIIEALPSWLQGGPTPRFNHFVPPRVNRPLVKLILEKLQTTARAE